MENFKQCIKRCCRIVKTQSKNLRSQKQIYKKLCFFENVQCAIVKNQDLPNKRRKWIIK